MFSFLKKKNIELANTLTGFTNIHADIHSHIIPGIDDGSPDIETSLELIKGLRSLGFTKLKGTPHIIGDLYRNSPATIIPAFERLKDACTQANIDVELSFAAEYMLDDYFLDLLRKKAPLLTIHSNILLTELPFNSLPANLEEITFEIFTAGYQPILAHPERYNYCQKSAKQAERFKELGFSLQVNLLSFTGYYGKPVAKAAQCLMEADLVDNIGTDLHHFRHLEALKQNLPLLQKAIGDIEYNQFK
jgi:protein-tyrosine phosphatase